MHRLSKFAGDVGLQILRDGDFLRTGRLSTPMDRLCVPLRSSAYVDEVNANPRVTAVITTAEIAEQLAQRFAVGISQEPDSAHSEIHSQLAALHENQLRASPTAIHPSAVVDPSSHVAGYGVTIGANCRIGSNVTITPGVTIGDNCTLHPGIVLGVPAFNTAIIAGRRKIIPQVGGVRLQSHVEMLANCTVARAVYGGETTIGEETLIDNLVYIAHDVQIGRRVQICALANILGRTIVGDESYIGPSAVVKNGLVLGNRSRVSIGAVVTQDVSDDEIVSGNFAIPHERFIEHVRSIR